MLLLLILLCARIINTACCSCSLYFSTLCYSVSLDKFVPDQPMRIWGNGIEPVDQIYEYCRAYKLNRDIQTAILNDACRPNLYPGIKCTRGEALVYTKDVQVQIKSNCTCTWNSTTNTTLIVPLTEEEETSLPLEPEFKNIWAQKNISRLI